MNRSPSGEKVNKMKGEGLLKVSVDIGVANERV